MRPQTFGFGVDPLQNNNHFLVFIMPKEPNTVPTPTVKVYERFSWNPEDQNIIVPTDKLRISISKHKWEEIKSALTAEFNSRLKKNDLKNGKFLQVGGTPVERLFGKEMMVLLWAIEDTDPSIISTAVRNWKGLMPEERWWLYTMTNAATGGIKDRHGWRKALKFALCENPVIERKQPSLLDNLELKL
jgi:hypothetical protein